MIINNLHVCTLHYIFYGIVFMDKYSYICPIMYFCSFYGG